jgi:hypothetical protein
MNEKIAIIDFLEQDDGIKILFPNADLFVLREQLDRSETHSKYKINTFVHNKNIDVFQNINDINYDYLFIVASLYDGLLYYNEVILNSNTHLKNENNYKEINEYLNKTLELIKTNNFKKICFFDNYDYDYDPNSICNNGIIDLLTIQNKNILFFKRNYNKKIEYQKNVFPFPYIIFGQQNNIDMITDLFYKNMDKNNKINRLFFSGCLFNHNYENLPEINREIYGCKRNRIDIYSRIKEKVQIYNPGAMYHTDYMNQMRQSKYSLDLLGVGDPNIRTFEILSSGSLRISQRSNLKWNFEDDFCEETYFDDENDLCEKIYKLDNDFELYKKCLDKQNFIVSQYMNFTCLRNYICNKLI